VCDRSSVGTFRCRTQCRVYALDVDICVCVTEALSVRFVVGHSVECMH